jgi:uncharacterized protein YndB with AHSA1/START domain
LKDTLNVTTSGDRQIVITRQFNATRALVWDAMSRPELLKRWLSGPPGWEMTTCEDEQKVGGTFRWVWTGQGTMTMTGTYREFVAPERCVRTESFECEGMPPMGEQLATLVLTEKGGVTTLTLTVEYPSKEARDGALAGGMDKGLASSYANLDEILAGVKA